MQTNKPSRYKINFFSRGEKMPPGDPPPFKGLLEQHQKNLRMKQLRSWLGVGIGIIVIVAVSIFSYILDKSGANNENAGPVAAVVEPRGSAGNNVTKPIDSAVAVFNAGKGDSITGTASRRQVIPYVQFIAPITLYDTSHSPFANIVIAEAERPGGNIAAVSDEARGIKAIRPPYKMWDVKYQKFHVNADSTSVIIMPTGTKFSIAPHSLADAAGNIVRGDIQIICREFFDPVDIALAGVPMAYDSAGKRYQLETAGMFEIRGYYQGKPVQLIKGKTIRVSQASLGDDTYNTYYLDTVTGKWTYKGKPESRRVPINPGNGPKTGTKVKFEGVSEESDRVIYKKKYVSKLPDGPILEQHAQMPKPKLRDMKNPGFKVPVDTLSYPELAGFRNMIFEIGPGQPRVPNNKWVKMYIKRGNLASSYTLVLVKGKSEYPYSAYLAFEQGEDYDRAMEVYKQYYQDMLHQQANTDSMTRAARNRALEAALIIEAARKERISSGQPAQTTGRINDVEVWREFAISNFGMWNCDKVVRFPIVEKLNIRISIQGAVSAELQDINVLARQYNSIWLCHPVSDGMYQLEYNRGDDIFLFAILQGTGKIALIDSDEFRRQLALIRSGAQDGLKMTIIDEHFANSREVKAYILTRFLVDN